MRARIRRAMARAAALLTNLSSLQADLPGGAADPDRLARLADDETPPDPLVAEAVAAVALRARVELAKRRILPAPPVASR